MGRELSAHGKERHACKMPGKERDHYKNIDIDGGNNIRMDIREIGWGGIDWIDLAQDKDQ
jgi:hypothetical protein